MSDRGYYSRPYKKGDEEEIILLLDLVFDNWPRFDLQCSKKEHWIWKMVDTPTKIHPVVVAETDEGKIIGVSQGIIKKTKIGDEVVLVRKGAELAVQPEYRRIGVSNSIAEIRTRMTKEMEAALSYNLTASQILISRNKRRSIERRSPEFPQPITQLVKIKDVDKFLHYLGKKKHFDFRHSLTKYGIIFLKTINNMGQLFSSRVRPKSDFTLNEIIIFHNGINQFWHEIKDDYDFIVEKSMSYLNWRYCDIRGGSYSVWVAEDNGHILGYMVLKINRIDPEHPIGYIIEILALRDREDVVHALVNQAEKYFDEHMVNSIYFTIILDHPYERIMKSHGFIDSRRRPYLYYRIYREIDGIDKFVNGTPDRIHYQFGEFDSI
jgi:hypothetical protein